ncbi:MAG: hypothetical protein V1660_01570 [archaeon]
MITYQELYDLLRKDKYSEQLQDLPKNFFSDVGSYIAEKKGIISKEDDMFSDAIVKTKKQMENSIAVFKELMMRRKKKILDLAFVASETGISKKDFENMIQYEKEIFEIVTQKLEDATKILSNIINGHEQKKLQNQLIKFNKDVESFLEENGSILGPFKKGEMANLPAAIAQILVQGEKASIIESD